MSKTTISGASPVNISGLGNPKSTGKYYLNSGEPEIKSTMPSYLNSGEPDIKSTMPLYITDDKSTSGGSTSEDAQETEKPQSYNIVDTLGKGAVDPTSGEYNTGSGSAAAVGTKYSWDKKAEERAQLSYKSDVLKAKQDALTRRQEIETQAQQYQLQSDMQKYIDNQSADKAGWAGGYVLDQNRQREYLQQSINASMFNAMELQKYGYKSQLQAARLAFDSNMADLAMEYYNQAVQNSINEAQVTGIYMSAEQKDMLSQWSAAQALIEDSSIPDDDDRKARAKGLSDKINSWFAEQKISAAGVKTLASISKELELLSTRTAITEAAFNQLSEAERRYTFITGVDMKTGEATTINLHTANKDAILQYIKDKGDKAVSNVNQYFQFMMMDLMTGYANSTSEYTTEGFNQYISQHKDFSEFIHKFDTDDGGNSLMQYITDKTASMDYTNEGNGGKYTLSVEVNDKNELVLNTEDKSDSNNNDGSDNNSGSDTNDKNNNSNSDNNNNNDNNNTQETSHNYGADMKTVMGDISPILNGKSTNIGIKFGDKIYSLRSSGQLITSKSDGALIAKLAGYYNGSPKKGDIAYHNNKIYLCVDNAIWTELNGNGTGVFGAKYNRDLLLETINARKNYQQNGSTGNKAFDDILNMGLNKLFRRNQNQKEDKQSKPKNSNTI